MSGYLYRQMETQHRFRLEHRPRCPRTRKGTNLLQRSPQCLRYQRHLHGMSTSWPGGPCSTILSARLWRKLVERHVWLSAEARVCQGVCVTKWPGYRMNELCTKELVRKVSDYGSRSLDSDTPFCFECSIYTLHSIEIASRFMPFVYLIPLVPLPTVTRAF